MFSQKSAPTQISCILLNNALTRMLPLLPESQSKELAEMLAQEDLGEMGLTSPSEQVAYLLVERATLLERLEAAERRLESQNFTDGLREVQHQVKDWLLDIRGHVVLLWCGSHSLFKLPV